jgi:hypothetical protein
MSDDLDELALSVRDSLIPKLQASAAVVSIIPDDPAKIDIKIALEIGAGLLLDKPLFLAIPDGAVVPQRLVRAADRVMYFNSSDPDWVEHLTQEIKDFIPA